jgi:hypothetical protein
LRDQQAIEWIRVMRRQGFEQGDVGIDNGEFDIARCLEVGGGLGAYMAQKVEMTKMPELVAFMHSMIGLSNRLGRPLTAPEGEELRRGYPAGCTDAELDDLAARMRGAGVKLSAVGG